MTFLAALVFMQAAPYLLWRAPEDLPVFEAKVALVSSAAAPVMLAAPDLLHGRPGDLPFVEANVAVPVALRRGRHRRRAANAVDRAAPVSLLLRPVPSCLAVVALRGHAATLVGTGKSARRALAPDIILRCPAGTIPEVLELVVCRPLDSLAATLPLAVDGASNVARISYWRRWSRSHNMLDDLVLDEAA